MMRCLDALMPLNLGLDQRFHIIWNFATSSSIHSLTREGKNLKRRGPQEESQKQSKIGPLCWSNSFNKINSFENLIISFCLLLLFDNQIKTFWLSISYINLPKCTIFASLACLKAPSLCVCRSKACILNPSSEPSMLKKNKFLAEYILKPVPSRFSNGDHMNRSWKKGN